MADAQPDSSPALTVRDVIIIACVCAVIIITLLIILICFICRRRRANAKEYENSGVPPSASNGGIPGKKMHQGQGQPQPYDNADGRADGYRGQQESISMQGRPMSPHKDKYIDLEDRKDPSLQSQESGYSTGDPNKPKKVIYEVVV